MINNKENPVAWANFMYELDEARGHLDDLVNEMNQSGIMDDPEFQIDIDHVYAHLNRAWHSRHHDSEITDEEHTEFTNFPTDVYPVG